ncbi:MAG: hypothetical protein EHM39_13115, partial [Chloroflexi bacterium]
MVNRMAQGVLGVGRLPLHLVQSVIRHIGRGLSRLFAPAVRRLDASPKLSNVINSLSSSMATQRGLLLLIGTVLLLLSLVTHAIVLLILVSSEDFGRNLYWLCIPFTLMHVGVLA